MLRLHGRPLTTKGAATGLDSYLGRVGLLAGRSESEVVGECGSIKE
jgi:hypothetical protein